MSDCPEILIQAAAGTLLLVFRFDMTHNIASGMYTCHISNMLLALGKGLPDVPGRRAPLSSEPVARSMLLFQKLEFVQTWRMKNE